MRLALLGLVASFSVQPLLAQDNLRVSQAPVTISATFVRTGAPGEPKNRPDDADVNVTTPAEAARYGNGMVLRAALSAALDETPEEVSISGWSLVAVWANWPETGNGYKFFARKKGETPVLVPDEVLSLELTDPYVAQKLTRRSGNIVAGSDTHKSLAQLNLGGLGTSDDNRYETNGGIATGVLFGTGRYTRPAGATTAFYLPQGDRFVGYGVTNMSEGENEPDAIITVTLSIGASHAVAASVFAPSLTEDTDPEIPSQGPGVAPEGTGPDSLGTSNVGPSGAGIIKASSGSITVNTSGGLTVSGSTVVASGTIAASAVTSSGTLNTGGTPVSTGTDSIGSGVLVLDGSVSLYTLPEGGDVTIAPPAVTTSALDLGTFFGSPGANYNFIPNITDSGPFSFGGSIVLDTLPGSFFGEAATITVPGGTTGDTPNLGAAM
jgi:hypothetical protein